MSVVAPNTVLPAILADGLGPSCDVEHCNQSSDWWVVCRACGVYLFAWCDPHKRDTEETFVSVAGIRLWCKICDTQRHGLYRYERV